MSFTEVARVYKRLRNPALSNRLEKFMHQWIFRRRDVEENNVDRVERVFEKKLKTILLKIFCL